MSFKVGDVVRLKSGGPAMTIRWIDDDEANCDWFDDKGNVKNGSFPLPSLIVQD